MHRIFPANLLLAILFVACSKSPAPAGAVADWEAVYSGLVQKYAGASGVEYRKWKENREDLDALKSVTAGIAREDISGKSRDEKLAFYLNAYNAWILHEMLEAYPVEGPGDGSAIKRGYFFKSKRLTVAGKKMSFSGLENEIIRPTFKEPRIHFALNCASLSCPPLHDAAFDAATLDATLTRLTRAFVNRNPRGFQLSPDGKTARVSKIFDWYGEDFKGEGGVLPYINRFRDEPAGTGLEVEFMEYDWRLNEAR